MAQWSLRTKLVFAAAIALIPALDLAAWSTYRDIDTTDALRDQAMVAGMEQSVSQYRELIEGSRRMFVAACNGVAVRASLEKNATTGDLGACGGYLSNVLERFPGEYASALVTDGTGVARCSTSPSEVGVNFSGRQIFKLVRDHQGVSVGALTTGRDAQAVLPIGTQLVIDGKFRGMCAIDVALQAFFKTAVPTGTAQPSADRLTPIALVDQGGAPVGGSAAVARVLPVAARLSAAIAAGQKHFDEFGQDGAFYRFHIVPLVGDAIHAVGAMPLDRSVGAMLFVIGRYASIGLAAAIVLVTMWFGADRWCVRPLRYIGDFTGRVARGEDVHFAPKKMPRTQELIIVGEGVARMAEAIASREAELKSGLEQRDHMLREIHHRVKNNLQMISSLLNLQAGEIRSPRIRRFFGDAQNRVLTLSILHRHLYERSSWSLVDFQQFISDLVRQISVSRPGIPRPPVRYQIRAPIMAVGPDIAIPVGLIVTEAVSSALGHDFSTATTPEIRIEAKETTPAEVELVVEDNGVGEATNAIGPNVRASFGLTLIRGLAMQLGGEARVSESPSGGTRLTVTFPMPREEETNA
jgi:two-component sensor histidine kinase